MSHSSSNNSSNRKEIHENGVVRGKTARACDNCVKKRARWYCGADDSFLCHPCDASVHSANSLALRHHRLPLKPSSHKPPLPTWHRKPRTPRNHSSNKHLPHHASSRAVPELYCDDHNNVATTDEHLLYRVPIFDPLVAELCTTTTSNDDHNIKSYDINYESNGIGCYQKEEQMVVVVLPSSDEISMQFGLLPTEVDLAEFAADVESLLGHGLDEECDFGMEGLGFVDFNDNELSCFDGRVKIELNQLHEEKEDQEEVKTMDVNMKMWPEPFELNMEDYEEESEEEEDNSKASELSSTKAKTEPELLEEVGEKGNWSKKTKTKKKKKILLSLDYEGVITAWASQGSPWTNGARPDFDPDRDACWPADTMGTYSTQFPYHHHYVDMSGVVGGTAPAILLDGGREARVLRYREKRRTRLFEKKIRYEVRKLNAEKRPRMKGRFVKRASFGGSCFPMLND